MLISRIISVSQIKPSLVLVLLSSTCLQLSICCSEFILEALKEHKRVYQIPLNTFFMIIIIIIIDRIVTINKQPLKTSLQMKFLSSFKSRLQSEVKCTGKKVPSNKLIQHYLHSFPYKYRMLHIPYTRKCKQSLNQTNNAINFYESLIIESVIDPHYPLS